MISSLFSLVAQLSVSEKLNQNQKDKLQKLSTEFSVVNDNPIDYILFFQKIWDCLSYKIIGSPFAKQKRRKHKIYNFIKYLIAAQVKLMEQGVLTTCDQIIPRKSCIQFQKISKKQNCRGTESIIFSKLQSCGWGMSQKTKEKNGASGYILFHEIILTQLLSPESVPDTSTVKKTKKNLQLISAELPQSTEKKSADTCSFKDIAERALHDVYTPEFFTFLKEKTEEFSEKITLTPAQEVFKTLLSSMLSEEKGRKSTKIQPLIPQEVSIVESKPVQKVDEVKELLDYSMKTFSGLPVHREGTKTYKKVLFWLKQLHAGTFIKTKPKLKSFCAQQLLPLQIVDKPLSIKQLRLILRRLHLLRRDDEKIKTYSLADLIYNPYHPSGYFSPILTLIDDEMWNSIQDGRKKVVVSSEYPTTEKKFVTLLHLDPDSNKQEFKQLQKILGNIVLFRRWLPHTGGQFDGLFPLNKPGRFLKYFYEYIVQDRQITVRSVWDLSPDKPLFRQFLMDRCDGGSSGFVKDLIDYLSDYTQAHKEVPKGQKRIKFLCEILDFTSPGGIKHPTDQIICLPTEEADHYINRKKAIPYDVIESRCKSYAVRY